MIYDCDRTWWHLTCGNLWLPVTGISQAIICPVLMFFFSSGNISVNPHDYQLVKNENFSEWVSKGPHKIWQSKDLSGQYPILTRHCPLTSPYLQPCIHTINIKNKEKAEKGKRNIIKVFLFYFYYEVVNE